MSRLRVGVLFLLPTLVWACTQAETSNKAGSSNTLDENGDHVADDLGTAHLIPGFGKNAEYVSGTPENPTDSLCVDGTDEGGNLAGDGEKAPFYVFDPNLQNNVAGPFKTRRGASRVCTRLDNERRAKLAAKEVQS